MTQDKRRKNWKRLVDEQSNSGLNVAEWCRQKALNDKTFRRWKRKLTANSTSNIPAMPAGWCQIQAKPTAERSASLKLLVNGQVSIELQSGFDHQLLLEVLGILCP